MNIFVAAVTVYLLYALVCSPSFRCEIRKSFVSDMVKNARYSCKSCKRNIHTTASEIQCVSRCSVTKDCSGINFKEDLKSADLKNNCEVLFGNINEWQMTSEQNWKVSQLQRIGENVVTETEKDNEVKKVFNSCIDVYKNRKATLLDGIYELKSGKHFCRMTHTTNCGTGGWTLAIKIDGSKQTFKSDSAFWTNDVNYNVENGLNSSETEEAKYPAFSSINFTAVCIEITTLGVSKRLLIPQVGSSLLDVFKAKVYIPTNFGRSVWKGLMHDSSLQLDCNREGFNVMKGSAEIFARIGIIGNNAGGSYPCDTPNSYIGLGTIWDHPNSCSDKLTGVSCGNLAFCNADNGAKSVAALGSIFIR